MTTENDNKQPYSTAFAILVNGKLLHSQHCPHIAGQTAVRLGIWWLKELDDRGYPTNAEALENALKLQKELDNTEGPNVYYVSVTPLN
ncbi:hypothetical protein REH81_11460 [Vibrio rotiferianus]